VKLEGFEVTVFGSMINTKVAILAGVVKANRDQTLLNALWGIHEQKVLEMPVFLFALRCPVHPEQGQAV